MMSKPFLVAALLLPQLVLADVIRIDDGSVIQGTVSGIADGKLTVATEFAGTLTIDRSRVVTVETDDARLVELPDGDRVVARFAVDPEGRQLLRTEQRGALPAPTEELVAIYAPDADPDAPVWSGQAALGLAGATGNADNQSIQLRIDGYRKTPDSEFATFLQQRFAEQNSVETENELLLGARYEHDFSERSFYFVSSTFETDEFEDLDLRVILSGGYGYRFWERPDSGFSALVGLGVQRQEFQTGVSNTEPLVDLGYKYRRDFGAWLRLRHSLNLQPQLDDPTENYRAVADVNVDVPIGDSGAWLVRLGMRADYNSQPQPGVEELDTTYTVNMVYSY